MHGWAHLAHASVYMLTFQAISGQWRDTSAANASQISGSPTTQSPFGPYQHFYLWGIADVVCGVGELYNWWETKSRLSQLNIQGGCSKGGENPDRKVEDLGKNLLAVQSWGGRMAKKDRNGIFNNPSLQRVGDIILLTILSQEGVCKRGGLISCSW